MAHELHFPTGEAGVYTGKDAMRDVAIHGFLAVESALREWAKSEPHAQTILLNSLLAGANGCKEKAANLMCKLLFSAFEPSRATREALVGRVKDFDISVIGAVFEWLELEITEEWREIFASKAQVASSLYALRSCASFVAKYDLLAMPSSFLDHTKLIDRMLHAKLIGDARQMVQNSSNGHVKKYFVEELNKKDPKRAMKVIKSLGLSGKDFPQLVKNAEHAALRFFVGQGLTMTELACFVDCKPHLQPVLEKLIGGHWRDGTSPPARLREFRAAVDNIARGNISKLCAVASPMKEGALVLPPKVDVEVIGRLFELSKAVELILATPPFPGVTRDSVHRFQNSFQQSLAGVDGPLIVLGVDAEWRPGFSALDEVPCALLQLAVERHVFLIDLPRLLKNEDHATLNSLFGRLLSFAGIVKAGVGIDNDFGRIFKSSGLKCFETVVNVVDLMRIHKFLSPDPPVEKKKKGGEKKAVEAKGEGKREASLPKKGGGEKKRKREVEESGKGAKRARKLAKQKRKADTVSGLSLLCQTYLGSPLCKRMQLSNWEFRPLLPQQIQYAAKDAWVSVPLLRTLLEKAGDGAVEEDPLAVSEE